MSVVRPDSAPPDPMSPTSHEMSFPDVIGARRSPRQFLPEPLTAAEIRGVLEDAQRAPSNSNTQPWVVHLVSGTARDTLGRELVRAFDEDRPSPDFTVGYGQGVHLDRSQQHAAASYGSFGVERADRAGRRDVNRRNMDSYGAPHIALLFMPVLGDGVRTAGDLGMYAQNFLLALTARGLAGIPQTVLGMYAGTVREVLGIPDELKLLFGIGFGRADTSSPAGTLHMDRVPLSESVVLHDTPAEVLG